MQNNIGTQQERHIDMDDVIDPRLPPELEREIFEVAARLDRAVCGSLLLVAKRVHLWLEPILYETIIQDKCSGKEVPFPLSSEKSRYVKSLLLGGTTEWGSVHEVLRDCPNVTNLALWCRVTPSCFDIIKHLQLKRLSANFNALKPSRPPVITHYIVPFGLGLGFGAIGGLGGGAPPFSVENESTPYPFSHFQTLTHLELTNFCGDWETCSELGMLPNLTHLAFNYQVPEEVVRGALVECKGLKVLVSSTFHYTAVATSILRCCCDVLDSKGGGPETSSGGREGEQERENGKEGGCDGRCQGIIECEEMATFSGIEDIRLVYLSQPAKEVVRDWEREVYGEISFWKVADGIVAKRKRKEEALSAGANGRRTSKNLV